MTEQEAIKRINGSSQYAYNHFGFVDKDGEAFDMAISALEKQIPKKPKITIHNGYCSNCHDAWGHDRLVTEERYGYKYFQYCPICGQRIDWSEVEA